MIRKFIFASLNVDETLLDDADAKERNLIYASFIRLLLSSLVVFGVTLYACNTVPALAGLYAWLIASVVAMIIFWFDSAIIGSEWGIAQENQSDVSKASLQPFVQKVFANLGRKLLRLMPRILFSITIASFIATIAELAVQKEAIETILTRSANLYNKETGNTQRREALTGGHAESIFLITERKTALEESKDLRGKANFAERLEAVQNDIERLVNAKAGTQNILENLTAQKLELEQRLIADEEQVVALQGERDEFRRLMDEEVNDPDKCRVSGADKCRGVKWEEYRNSMREAEAKLGKIEPEVSGKKAELQALITAINNQEAVLGNTEQEIEIKNQELDDLGGQNSGKTLEELDEELEVVKIELAAQEEKNASELKAFDEDEVWRGQYRDPFDYDFLLLYSGLQELHDDPQKGAGAIRFSWGLFIFIVLMELSAVLTAMFFSPYSMYASRAYVKIKKRQVEEEAEINKFRHRQETQSFVSDELEETLKKAKSTLGKSRAKNNPDSKN